MLIIVSVVSAALVVLICFFAFSGNSTVPVRWAARIALAVIALSVGVCLFIVFSGPAVRAGPSADPAVAEEPVMAAAQDMTAVVVFVVILVLLVALVLFLSFLDRRKRNAAPLKTLPRW
jgi:hypothetical protein